MYLGGFLVSILEEGLIENTLNFNIFMTFKII